MATPKNTTLMFYGKNDPPLPSRNVPDRICLRCSVFSKRSLVRVVRENITYVI